MNRGGWLYAMASVAIAILDLALRPAAAEKLEFSPIHTAAEKQCLADLLPNSRWRRSPEIHGEMMATAIAAKASLSVDRRTAYFYVFEGPGWCGTIGCTLLIGEVRSGGRCRLLYDGTGFAYALRDGSEPIIELLRARDHGYRRLYTPCETRFDGRKYQKLRAECSRLDVQR
jgi:hypothetical protein